MDIANVESAGENEHGKLAADRTMTDTIDFAPQEEGINVAGICRRI